MNIIELRHVTRRYPDGFTALHDINLSLEPGKFYSLLGPSGSGKTTILRLIAGFDQPTAGEILFKGRDITNLPASRRPLNTVFQNYALFPHLNVFDNIAFGLKVKKVAPDEIKKKVERMLSLVRLEGFGKRSVQELSGGQQQRVAIARALVNHPKVLLLDESLSALDKKLRKTMQFELRSIQKQLGITFIFVTHDQEEALAMSDEIFVLNDGRLQQSGSPSAIYDEPVNEFVARFIGDSNLMSGHMIRDFEVEFGNHRFECADAGIKPGEQVQVLLRPEDLSLVEPAQGKIVVDILSQLFLGDHYEIWAKDDGGFNWLIHTVEKAPAERCGLHFAPDAIHVMRLGESESEFDQRLSQYEEHEK
ncbi:MAG: ABC transporter ATP-binding protein [Lactobacillus sp.]|nr:ABC transporter ATP-binding protein [Lactobacillus sp.]MCH4068030.1 ABC transporter ATP-binding protein [Lactobacillus sp.]MCI1304014.1 ABC transporter ATP-binding protein [Lactobacillus sp.]MCI1329960.1 ABC transporter ATP-binding protein [Lactobacillus sp.]MCI1359798.1 ABC transporter ATP-binding protein [Lactobacillus sp.]